MNSSPRPATTGNQPQVPARLGFAVIVGEDGQIPKALLIGLKAAGYDGIEPNCYQPQHLPGIVALCRKVGLAIHAPPTGRWMNVAEASEDYDRYTKQALAVLGAGASIAAALGVPFIFGLIRGRAAIGEGAAKEFPLRLFPALCKPSRS